jgi:hypothetical protein
MHAMQSLGNTANIRSSQIAALDALEVDLS